MDTKKPDEQERKEQIETVAQALALELLQVARERRQPKPDKRKAG